MVRAVFIMLLISIASALPTEAKKIYTKLKAPAANISTQDTRIKVYPHQRSKFDLVEQKLIFIAYDKRAGADKETFFVENGSESNLSKIEIEIKYFVNGDKQIHSQTVELKGPFPAKETRKVDIKSWDTQKSYHYINSTSSQKGSTPYTVRFRILSFTEEE